MIVFTKSTLDMNKLHMLLLERRALIIRDFEESEASYQNFKLTFDDDSIVLSCESSLNPSRTYPLLEVSDYRGLEFTSAGQISLSWNRSSSSLTLDDLLKFGILDESKVAYVATYEASQESYSTECRLLGVYSSFAEYQLQASKIIGGVEDVDVNVVKLNALEDLFLNGYQE